MNTGILENGSDQLARLSHAITRTDARAGGGVRTRVQCPLKSKIGASCVKRSVLPLSSLYPKLKNKCATVKSQRETRSSPASFFSLSSLSFLVCSRKEIGRLKISAHSPSGGLIRAGSDFQVGFSRTIERSGPTNHRIIGSSCQSSGSSLGENPSSNNLQIHGNLSAALNT